VNLHLKGIPDDSEEMRYFLACARLRGITATSLLRRLLTVVTKDQLIPSILDDEGEKPGPREGEKRYSELRMAV
jgi:hypothetical protein